jgi:hypothetical protein
MELSDMCGGQLSYQGIDLLRDLEKCDHYSSSTILPSSTMIRKVGNIVDKYVDLVVPFKLSYLDNGTECIKFNPEEVLVLIYEAYDLVEIANTISGSQPRNGWCPDYKL